ncbi:uncharacterized GPI-anchored protein At4g28100 [Beta vulgaris subsp. vulgaris]|uniref:uncharacterized GPI-anchored protein At4g28100 n=1 Tax=Beta vulgaris subsp. vulgaris TaxID=3555 RepID=UPI0020370151|nr:uncharacterized GPI-anchored protein At4g28100 [Beta vulgaris subsp. vulgaris]
METFHYYAIIIVYLSLFYPIYISAGLLSEPVQPTKPGDYPTTPNTVPAFPVQTDSQTCHLDLSDELFGGVNEACGHNLDRSRCCPVLAAWLYAAHARSALEIPPARPPVSPDSDSELPMMPESDSQKCVNSLQNSLSKRNITLPQPNNTCDTVLCFCGIRLHQIASLSCPAAFKLTLSYRNATPTANVRNLEKNCRNSSYAGCTKCLGSLEKLKGGGKNGTKGDHGSSRVSKMFNRDCQLMGLTWLLARNKTAYIPTVSAVLRAIMYSTHPPHQSKCSPDQENMPLAVDSLQFYRANSSASSTPLISFSLLLYAFFFNIIMFLFLLG